MNFIVVIASIAAMLLGFIPMSAVDRFNVERNAHKRNSEITENRSVLIYGKSETADGLEAVFAQKKRPCDHAGIEAQIGRLKKYGVIFIMGSDDYDNLLSASKFDLKFPEAKQILLCNDQMYSDLFRKTGKKFVVKDVSLQASSLIDMIDR